MDGADLWTDVYTPCCVVGAAETRKGKRARFHLRVDLMSVFFYDLFLGNRKKDCRG
jgi:hypothetical protein